MFGFVSTIISNATQKGMFIYETYSHSQCSDIFHTVCSRALVQSACHHPEYIFSCYLATYKLDEHDVGFVLVWYQEIPALFQGIKLYFQDYLINDEYLPDLAKNAMP